MTSPEQPDIFGSYLLVRVRPIVHPGEIPPARAHGILTQVGRLDRPSLRFFLP